MTQQQSQQQRRIEYRPLSSLKRHPQNPKAHDVPTLNGSVGRFGYIGAIDVDGRTDYVISGHGRADTLDVMKARGEDPPDGVILGDNGDWLVPVGVGWESNSDTEAVAALIALNQTTTLGGWVDESLLSLLDNLSQVDGGLVGVGFSDEEIAALREATNVPDFDPDDSDIARLDRKSVCDCPKCGHTFTPVTRTMVVDDDG